MSRKLKMPKSKSNAAKADKPGSANKSNEDYLNTIENILKSIREGRVVSDVESTKAAKDAKAYLNGIMPTIRKSKIPEPKTLHKILDCVEKKQMNDKKRNEMTKNNTLAEAKTELERLKVRYRESDQGQQTTPSQNEITATKEGPAAADSDWGDSGAENDKLNGNQGSVGAVKKQDNLPLSDMNTDKGSGLMNKSNQPKDANSAVSHQAASGATDIQNTDAPVLHKQVIQKEKPEEEKVEPGNTSLQETKTQQLQAEVESLRTRLSEVAAKNLTTGNANIADLSDPNRPTKLADQFSELYDNVWSDAFEELAKEKHFQGKEETIPKYLLNIIQIVDQFCKESERHQFMLLQNAFKLPMLFPFLPLETSAKKKPTMNDKTDVQNILDSAVPILKAAQRTACRVSLDELTNELFTKKMKDVTPKFPKVTSVRKYTKSCLELLWLMRMQDPPMYLAGFKESELSQASFREYMEKGKSVVSCVWPALFLFEGGPLMRKGVAVFK